MKTLTKIVHLALISALFLGAYLALLVFVCGCSTPNPTLMNTRLSEAHNAETDKAWKQWVGSVTSDDNPQTRFLALVKGTKVGDSFADFLRAYDEVGGARIINRAEYYDAKSITFDYGGYNYTSTFLVTVVSHDGVIVGIDRGFIPP